MNDRKNMHGAGEREVVHSGLFSDRSESGTGTL
jgi:hypothetical protein